MNLTETAIKFLTCFCANDIEGLSALISDHFQFKGPLVECLNKETYLQSLQDNPPIGYQIEILKTFEDTGDVCLIYTFSKPGVHTPMVQYFKFENHRISETLLVFDTSVFAQNT